VTGGIQPGVLVRALSQEFLDAGLVARVLMAMPPRRRKRWTELEVSPEVENAYHDLLDKLQVLPMELDRHDGEEGPHILQLSPDAKACWVDFYNQWALEQEAAEGELAAALSKLEAYAARFAMVHHVVDHIGRDGNDQVPIERHSVEAGIVLARWFANEARRIYSTLTESEEERNGRRLVEFIRARGGKISPRKLQRSNERKYPTVEHAQEALQRLVAAEQGTWQDSPDQKQVGRKRAPLFVLHPTPDKTDITAEEDEDDDLERYDIATDTIPCNEQISNVSEGSVGFVGCRASSPEGQQPLYPTDELYLAPSSSVGYSTEEEEGGIIP
jgi:hypothetical protein